MLVKQGEIVARVDVASTRKAYETLPCVECTCCYCRNYVPASAEAPGAIRAVLYNLGIDIRKAARAIQFARADSNPLVWYNGIYHLFGEIVDPAPDAVDLDITRDFEVDVAQLFFGAHIHFDVDDPPQPIVRLEVWMDLPWVLDEAQPRA